MYALMVNLKYVWGGVLLAVFVKRAFRHFIIRWDFVFWKRQGNSNSPQGLFLLSLTKGIQSHRYQSWSWQSWVTSWLRLKSFGIVWTAESIGDGRYWFKKGSWVTTWGYELAALLRRRIWAEFADNDQKTRKFQSKKKRPQMLIRKGDRYSSAEVEFVVLNK